MEYMNTLFPTCCFFNLPYHSRSPFLSFYLPLLTRTNGSSLRGTPGPRSARGKSESRIFHGANFLDRRRKKARSESQRIRNGGLRGNSRISPWITLGQAVSCTCKNSHWHKLRAISYLHRSVFHCAQTEKRLLILNFSLISLSFYFAYYCPSEADAYHKYVLTYIFSFFILIYCTLCYFHIVYIICLYYCVISYRY